MKCTSWGSVGKQKLWIISYQLSSSGPRKRSGKIVAPSEVSSVVGSESLDEGETASTLSWNILRPCAHMLPKFGLSRNDINPHLKLLGVSLLNQPGCDYWHIASIPKPAKIIASTKYIMAKMHTSPDPRGTLRISRGLWWRRHMISMFWKTYCS